MTRPSSSTNFKQSSALPHAGRRSPRRALENSSPNDASVPAKASSVPADTTLAISIVMPVRNEAQHIAATLEQLVTQDYPVDDYEILVVDGCSSDDTRDIVNQFVRQGAPIRLLDNPRCWSSAGRNVGAQAARGDVVLVIDGHCEIPSDGHLRSVASAFLSSDADVIGRPQPLTVRQANSLQRAIAVARASRLGHHPDSYIYANEDRYVPAVSVGAAYRRSVFDKLGYFDERFDACEDVDFNCRADQAGLRCYLASDAKGPYYPQRTLGRLFVQLARYGRGRVRLARKHPATCSWKSMVPAVFVAWLLCSAFLAPWFVPARLLFVATCALYTTTVLAESARLAIVHRLGWPALWLPAVFATIHFAAGIGVLGEWLTGGWQRR